MTALDARELVIRAREALADGDLAYCESLLSAAEEALTRYLQPPDAVWTMRRALADLEAAWRLRSEPAGWEFVRDAGHALRDYLDAVAA